MVYTAQFGELEVKAEESMRQKGQKESEQKS